jgi:hypothetical protein
MKPMIKKHEKGQIIIILVLAFVGLLGFVAVAVDGGMIYSDRRFDQNAADASALAGAGVAAQKLENDGVNYVNFTCTSTDVQNAINTAVAKAKERALANNFTLEESLDNQHGVIVNCVDNVWNGAYTDKYLDVTVMVSTEVKTSFAHLFYNGPIRNTVEAVVRIRPRTSLTYGYAIAATREDCDGLEFDGSNDVSIFNGGVYSSGCFRTDGGVNVVSDNDFGNNYFSTLQLNGSGYVSPAPRKLTEKLPSFEVKPPNCSSLPWRGDITKPEKTSPILPGRYGSITVGNNDFLSMEKGLYCISNGIKMTGGDIEGIGVMIYLTGGDIALTGGTVDLEAPTSSDPFAFLGMLIYVAPGYNGQVTMAGNGDSFYMGTVYAPDGYVEVGGTSGINPTYSTQVISDRIKIHGNAKIDINFDIAQIYQNPAYLDMYK